MNEEVTEIHEAKIGQHTIAHMSFVDAKRFDVFNEVLVDRDFEWHVGDVMSTCDRMFAVTELRAVYFDNSGRQLTPEEGQLEASSVLIIFVTCEEISVDESKRSVSDPSDSLPS